MTLGKLDSYQPFFLPLSQALGCIVGIKADLEKKCHGLLPTRKCVKCTLYAVRKEIHCRSRGIILMEASLHHIPSPASFCTCVIFIGPLNSCVKAGVSVKCVLTGRGPGDKTNGTCHTV